MNYIKNVATSQPVMMAVGVVIVGFGLYFLGKKALGDIGSGISDLGKDAAGVVGGIFSGNNALTQNQTDASGNKLTAYQGAGILGTLGAAVNSASGGTAASLGEKLGGWAFDTFGASGESINTQAPLKSSTPASLQSSDNYTIY